jgi:hypothetical protein
MAGISIAAGDVPSAGKLTVQELEGVASSSLALTTTITDVPGATVTLTAQTSSAFYEATITTRISRTATGSASAAAIRLDLDGSSVAGSIIARADAASVVIYSLSRTWTGTLAAGSHTFKVRGSTPTSLIWTVDAGGDTNIVVKIFG